MFMKKDTVENRSTSETTRENISTFVLMVDVITRWRRFIFWCVVGSVVISTAVAFLIPPKFKATASVFPAERADLFGAFGALEGVSSLVRSFSPARSLASLTRDPELDKFLAILNSGRVLSEVIEKFDLVKVYDITSYPMEKTTKELLSNVDFTVETEGNLTITVYDEDPQRAADMANFFVDALNRANTDLMVQNARDNRKFIEDRYKKNLQDLSAAEDSLRAFQKHYGIIAMPEQIEASVKAGAELAAQLALKEVELAVLERSLASDHPTVIGTRIEVEELRRKISDLNSGASIVEGEMRLLVPFKKIPDLAIEYLRRYRDVEIQYKILQFITPLYEQAKVEVQRQTASVVVLDKAYPAERKSKPKRLLIILGGFLLGLLGSVAFSAFANRWTREKDNNTEFFATASGFLKAVAADVRSLRNRQPK